jgi:hypothetical protein
MVVTAHSAFDWGMIADHSHYVLDTRGWSRGRRLAGWQTL